MASEIYRDVRNGLDVWILENPTLQIAIAPAPGGKIMSLYDKRHGIEWLTQPVITPTITIGAGSTGMASAPTAGMK